MGWADRLFKARAGEPIGARQGFGILFDDLVAALCTLLVIALWRRVMMSRDPIPALVAELADALRARRLAHRPAPRVAPAA